MNQIELNYLWIDRFLRASNRVYIYYTQTPLQKQFGPCHNVRIFVNAIFFSISSISLKATDEIEWFDVDNDDDDGGVAFYSTQGNCVAIENLSIKYRSSGHFYFYSKLYSHKISFCFAEITCVFVWILLLFSSAIVLFKKLTKCWKLYNNFT